MGQASNAAEAIAATRDLKPDVLVIDIKMPERNGLAAIEEARAASPDTRVVVLSTYDNPSYLARSLALGAVDFVTKGSPKEAVIDTVRRAATGEGPREDSPIQGVRAAMSRKRDASDDDIPLTNRELQVLRHIALGLSNREIGRPLSISIETVKEHVQNILRKLTIRPIAP
ncbi:MAG: response regulator transcription factor [Pirellulaceae bacterium]